MQRSENGKVLPEDSKEMTALVTYLQWISKGIPIYADVPWLGVGTIQNYQEGNKDNGAQVFTQKCSPCHGGQGQGTQQAPPLWGDRSFNDGAGMATAANLAGFALNNMPYKNPTLQPQEAEDVAAFIDSQPRPHFQKASQ
jgi:thiosulfate dehydrogenase